jgi:DNA replication and repair protein RecF
LQLLDSINQGQQAILTTTDLKLFDPAFIKQHTIWFIKEGVVTDISPAGN